MTAGEGARRPGTSGLRAGLLSAVLVAAAALGAGCGAADGGQGGGGRVTGNTLTVVSLLPLTGPEATAARQMVRGQKIALAEAGGQAGAYRVTFNSVDQGSAESDQVREDAAASTRLAFADSQAIAVIGSLRFESAAVSVPLLDAAGMLHVSPAAGYPGFTTAVTPEEPDFWYPSGRRSFAALSGTDVQQARVMVAAIRQATGSARPRVAVEQAGGRDDETLAAAVERALRSAGALRVADRGDADAVIYAGDELARARELVSEVVRDGSDALVVFGDDLARTDMPERLTGEAARRALFVSSAPRPGSSAELRRFERAYRERFGRAPGPYAFLGYRAMDSVLRDGIARAGERANERGRVIEAYMSARRPPPTWSAFRPDRAGVEYLAVESAGSG